MAENTIVDGIFRMLGSQCEIPKSQAGKYIALVHIARCNNLNPCWQTVACGEAITLPTWTRASIEVNSTESSCLLAATSELIFTEYTVDSVATVGEFELEADWKRDIFDVMLDIWEKGERFLVCIELNDADRSQFAFAAQLLNSGEIATPAKSDNALTRATFQMQPSGKYFFTTGENLVFCN